MRVVPFLRQHVALVLVAILALGGSAYAGSKIGSSDLKQTVGVLSVKEVKPGKQRVTSARCRRGQLAIGGQYGLGGVETKDIDAFVYSAGLVQQGSKKFGSTTRRYRVGVRNTGDQTIVVSASVYCLKR